MSYGQWRELSPRKAKYGFECRCDNFILDNMIILYQTLGRKPQPDVWWIETNVSNGQSSIKLYINDDNLRDHMADAIVAGL